MTSEPTTTQKRKPGRPAGVQGRSALETRDVRRSTTIRVPGRKLSPIQSQRLIAARERQSQALELRKAGATYAQIAQQLGYSGVSSAEKAVKTAMLRLGREQAQEVLALDMHRLDEIQMRLTAAFRSGDLSQSDRILRVMAARWQLVAQYQGKDGMGGTAAPAQGHNTMTTNNVLVIQGSQREYVEGLMRATGVDTSSEESRTYLASLEQERKQLASGPMSPSPVTEREMQQVVEGTVVEEAIAFEE